MPRGKREQADQIILKLREAEWELSRGKTVPEAAKKIGVSERTCAVVRDPQYLKKSSQLSPSRSSFSPSTPRTPPCSHTKRSQTQTAPGRSAPPRRPSRPARRWSPCGPLDRAVLHPGAPR